MNKKLASGFVAAAENMFETDNCLLYAITEDLSDKIDESAHSVLTERIEAALEGGITMLQVRIKEKSVAMDQETVALLKNIQDKCRQLSVPFIINDYLELAKLLDADGIHLGPADLPIADARRSLGPGKIIGASAKSEVAALAAERDGADYLGVGAVFPTHSKSHTQAMPLEKLADISRLVNIPVVAIGGINEQNIVRLSGTGIAGVALISGIFSADDIAQMTAKLAGLSKRYFKNIF